MEDALQTVRELATHANDIKHLQDDMDKLVKDVKEIKDSIESIQRMLAEERGKDKTLRTVVTVAASAIGGAVVWVLDKVFK